MTSRMYRFSEVINLGTRVVVVELARHAVTLRFEHGRKAVAQGRLPSVAHMQRARGVCRHEFQQYPVFATRVRQAECRPLGECSPDHLLLGGNLQLDRKSTRLNSSH